MEAATGNFGSALMDENLLEICRVVLAERREIIPRSVAVLMDGLADRECIQLPFTSSVGP